MKRQNKAILMVIAVLAMSLGLFAEIGDIAGKLDIGQWVKGKPVQIEPGTIYVVEFWATWCPPCRRSIPHLSDLSDQYKDKGVVFIGISSEPAAKVQKYVKDHQAEMRYHVAIDNDRSTSNKYMSKYGVRGIPHAFLVDREGKVIWHGHPMGELDSQLKKLINQPEKKIEKEIEKKEKDIKIIKKELKNKAETVKKK